MTSNLKRTPRYWLTQRICESIFDQFSEKIQFDEPIPPFNTRFKGKLEGILESVRQTYDGKYLNPTVLDSAAAYFNQLVRGHAFQNGNKRLAVLYTHLFLIWHDVDFTVSWKGMYNFAVLIAQARSQGISSERTKELCREVVDKFTKNKG